MMIQHHNMMKRDEKLHTNVFERVFRKIEPHSEDVECP